MTDTVLAQLAALKDAPAPALKAKWRALFDSEPPPYNRRFLESRLAYRIQELAYGGLKNETTEQLRTLGKQYGGKPGTARATGLSEATVTAILSGSSGVGVEAAAKIAKAFSALSTVVPVDENFALFARIERVEWNAQMSRYPHRIASIAAPRARHPWRIPALNENTRYLRASFL